MSDGSRHTLTVRGVEVAVYSDPDGGWWVTVGGTDFPEGDFQEITRFVDSIMALDWSE